MCKPLITLLFVNGIVCYSTVLYQFVSQLFSNQRLQEDKIEYLCNKVCQLQNEIIQLKMQLNNQEDVMSKTQKINAQLENIIHTQYDIIDSPGTFE